MKEKKMKKGFMMVVALIITLAVGIVAVSLVGLTLQEYRLSARNSAYARAFHAAESGANLACEEFTKQVNGESGAWSGWSTTGAIKSFSNDLTTASGETVGSYSVTADPVSAGIYNIISRGWVSFAGKTLERAVKITVEKTEDNPVYFKYGLLSLSPIHIGGSVKADSFDSTDPTKSTNGHYDPAKASNNATLATLSSADPAIRVSGGGQLSGISLLAVAEGGTINIAHWIPYHGIKSYDASQQILDVDVPFSLPATESIDTGPWKSRYQTIHVNGSQDMSFKNISVVSDGKLTITGSGKLRVYVDKKLKVSGAGQLRIIPSPSTADLEVEFYTNGDVNIAGSGLLNYSYRAANCSIWGTENCNSISVTGNSGYIGTVYAPYATVKLSGSSAATGAFLGGSIQFTGASQYHIDESLFGSGSDSSSGPGKPYKLTYWTEL